MIQKIPLLLLMKSSRDSNEIPKEVYEKSKMDSKEIGFTVLLRSQGDKGGKWFYHPAESLEQRFEK